MREEVGREGGRREEVGGRVCVVRDGKGSVCCDLSKGEGSSFRSEHNSNIYLSVGESKSSQEWFITRETQDIRVVSAPPSWSTSVPDL